MLRMIRPAEYGTTMGVPAIVQANSSILVSLVPRSPAEAIATNKDLQEAGFGQ